MTAEELLGTKEKLRGTSVRNPLGTPDMDLAVNSIFRKGASVGPDPPEGADAPTPRPANVEPTTPVANDAAPKTRKEDFTFLKVIGRGSFGKVMMAQVRSAAPNGSPLCDSHHSHSALAAQRDKANVRHQSVEKDCLDRRQ